MSALVVVDRQKDWPLSIPEVQVISAKDYLTNPEFMTGRGRRVFNLCRSYRYQSMGYYVSLLAAARRHRPLPSVTTIQDLRHRSLIRLISEDLDLILQRSLQSLSSDRFVLSIYFGRNLARRHDKLALQLFNLFPAPFLRAHFIRQEDRWTVRSLAPIAAKDIPAEHQAFVLEAARDYFGQRHAGPRRRSGGRYDLAILCNPEEVEPPSDEKAIKRFVRAGGELGFDVSIIHPDDYGRLAEFDALFIRETTRVNHHTYRFARRAAAEGLVVIDDPDSIVRCANKVFLAERLERGRIPIPRTRIVMERNLDEVARELGFPCILKLPDSSFSAGVIRADDVETFRAQALRYLEDSDLLIAQEYVPTEFDWRVGIINRQVLFVCKYFMAREHWQVIKRDAGGRVVVDGAVETMLPEQAPEAVIDVAQRAAALIGDGLYGVDLKEVRGKPVIIEINDNPNVYAGFEDAQLGEVLYTRILRVLLDRVTRLKEGR